MSKAVLDRPTAPATPTKPTQLDLPWSEQDQAVFSQAVETAREEAEQQRREQRRLRESAASTSNAPCRTLLAYPTVFVLVPRQVAAQYLERPWADVFHAAERGVDGLAVVHERPRIWRGLSGEPPPSVPDVAFVSEGQDNWRGRTVLYQQNW